MNKYIKLDDAISKIVNTPTRVITDDLTALADRQHEIIDMLSDLPTIEVSEDCISREQVRAKLDYISYAEKDPIEIAKRIIEGYREAVQRLEKFYLGEAKARSVTTEQSSMVGEWIPCSERTPTKEGHFLGSFNEPHYIDNIYVGLAYWTGGRWHGKLANEIIAWMPLPKPWKGAEE